jgi:ribosomal protein S18 acetylase RimI-like enzyme
MPRETDPAALRLRLAADRAWAVYALGDLAPGLFEHTIWHVNRHDGALLMLYTGLKTPVLFATGAAASVRGLLEELDDWPKLYLLIRPEIMPLIQARYVVSHETAMWRMVLEPARFAQRPSRAVRLTMTDYPALLRLYTDGELTGEAPDFFAPDMVVQGVFYGVYEEGELVAAAGTHLVVPSEAVAAVGNVYTRRDRRGQGLATQVTSAVTAGLLRVMPPGAIIALNVSQTNTAALTVYRQLGFARYCEFLEGVTEPPPVTVRLV